MKNSVNSLIKFSVIVPVYNAEEWIGETIESVIGQDIGFLDNVEILLINDGSSDDSAAVCRAYAEKYPNNIQYFEHENRGVGFTRNFGLQKVVGKYLIMLDADDKLTSDLLRKSGIFFDAHYDEIDVVALKLRYFGCKDGEHWINERFTDDMVVDLTEDYEWGIFSASAVVLKSSVAKKLQFDETISVSEDGKYIQELLLKKEKLGILSGPAYLYRKLQTSTSASSQLKGFHAQEWFLETPTKVYGYLLDLVEKRNKTSKFIQYYVMSQLQFRYAHSTEPYLSAKQMIRYKNDLLGILKRIDDDVIMCQKKISKEYKLHLLGAKNNDDPLNKLELGPDSTQLYKGVKIFKYNANTRVYIEILDVKDNNIVIKGFHSGFRSVDVQLLFEYQGLSYQVSYVENIAKGKRYSLEDDVYDNNYFTLELPLIDMKDIEQSYPVMKVGSAKIKIRNITFGQFTGISSELNMSYVKKDDKVLIQKINKGILLKKYSKRRHAKNELNFLRECIEWKKYYVIVLRLLVFTIKLVRKRKVWMISDRLDDANDNGRLLFEYMNSKVNNSIIKPVFIVDKKSSGYRDLSSIGSVVPSESHRAKLLYLVADKIVSSQSRNVNYNVFENDKKNKDFLIDLINYPKRVFLSHGVHQGDMAESQNKLNKNYSLLTVSSIKEKENFLNGSYGFDRVNIAITGLPRYDSYSKHRMRKQILLSPTWRASIAGVITDSGKVEYSNSFKHTEYFHYYNGLLSDKKLLNRLEVNNYSLHLLCHPNIGDNIRDFSSSKNVVIATPPHDYKSYFNQSRLLITDYSSVAFDFAYTKKPIIYTQYDKSTFSSNHGWKLGHFSFEKDGFGPVEYNLQDTVERIIEYVENDCKMPEKYSERVDSFFRYNDSHNTERVYNAIVEM